MTQATTRIILVGAGHTHALFLQSLIETPLIDPPVVEQPLVQRPVSQQSSAQSQDDHHHPSYNPFQKIEILLISPLSLAPYSGMIPGWLAGQYEFSETVIDFDVLCKRVGAKWIKAELLGLDPDAQTINLTTGETYSYDWLSINIGSTLRPPEGLVPNVLALRPLWTLQQRYDAYLDSWALDQNKSPLTVTTVGAGAAGVESLLCILRRLRQMRPDRQVQGHLISRSEDILPGFSAEAKRLAHQALKDAQVTLHCNADWQNIIAVRLDESSSNESSSNESSTDLVIWATGAQAHNWQLDPACRLTLQVSADGFIQVDETLRSISHPNIFATGDCASLPSSLPKAGVYAVRMAGTLIANLHIAMKYQTPFINQVQETKQTQQVHQEHQLQPTQQVHHTQQTQIFKRFETQPYALALLNTGDGHAIASWRSFGFSGKSVWVLKDYIDKRFISRFK
jgi:NADH dehydrogenase FAD-containing subunit